MPFLNHIFNSSSTYALRQCFFLLIAPLVVGVIMAFPYGILRQRAELFYWISFVLLTVTTIFNRATGVKAWLDIIWGYTIQPAEFAKLAMILILAKNLSKQDQPHHTSAGRQQREADPERNVPAGCGALPC